MNNMRKLICHIVPPWQNSFPGWLLMATRLSEIQSRSIWISNSLYELTDLISVHTELYKHRTIPSDTQRSDHKRFLTYVEPKYSGSLISPPWHSGQRTTYTTQLKRTFHWQLHGMSIGVLVEFVQYSVLTEHLHAIRTFSKLMVS